MSYNLPKQQYKRDDYITLNEGFHRVGMFLFPQEWVGHEDGAWSATDHEKLSDEKRTLETNLHRCNQQECAVRFADCSGMDETEFENYSDLLEEAGCRTREAREKRDQFGQTYDPRYANALAYNRRQQVEKHLCDVIRSGKLNLHFAHGMWTDMENDFNLISFQISFLFSFVIMPINHGGRRRFPGYFSKKHFDIWAMPFETELQQYNSEPIEEQMLVWFRLYRDECLARKERPTKKASQARCKESFGEKNLPSHFDTKFTSAWNLLAPLEWIKGGAPKKP